MLTLRPYQTDAISATRAAWNDHSDVLGVAATGAGKTVIFISLALDLFRAQPNARIVILAHREELIHQPIERLRTIAGDWLMDVTEQPKVGLLMGETKTYDRQLTIATVQTLAREAHMKRLLVHGQIDYLITDEAHHAIAPAYLRVRDGLRAANAALKHLGVTATPMRGDGLAMANTFSHTAFTVTIADLVRQGFLVKPNWLAISTQIDLAGVKTTAGDFQQAQLAERFDTPQCRALVVAAHKEYAHDRPAIAFTTSVAGAHALAADFRAAGYTAASADGATDKAVRRQILADFRSGKYQVLVNCGLWTEGLDVPEIACIHLARPTRSDGLYIQMVGRGLRPTPNKTDCLILDYLPADARNVAMLGDILGCPIPREELLRQFRKQDQPGATQIGFTFDGDTFDAGGTDLQVVARELHYLDASPYVWHRRDTVLTLGCGFANDGIERILAITNGQLWCLWRRGAPDALSGGYYRSNEPYRIQPYPCADPFVMGEQLAAKHTNTALASKNRGWQSRPVSEGQGYRLKRLAAGALKTADIQKMTSGEATQLITHYQAVEAIDRFQTAQQAGVLVQEGTL